MTEVVRVDERRLVRAARVRLAHYPPTDAELRYVDRSRWARALRALTVALLLPPTALVAFLIPPHGEPLIATLGFGIYLIYREATTRYVVGSFHGRCPRCGEPLKLKPGTRLTSSRSLPCYGCHFHPTIDLAPVPSSEPSFVMPPR